MYIHIYMYLLTIKPLYHGLPSYNLIVCELVIFAQRVRFFVNHFSLNQCTLVAPPGTSEFTTPLKKQLHSPLKCHSQKHPNDVCQYALSMGGPTGCTVVWVDMGALASIFSYSFFIKVRNCAISIRSTPSVNHHSHSQNATVDWRVTGNIYKPVASHHTSLHAHEDVHFTVPYHVVILETKKKSI